MSVRKSGPLVKQGGLRRNWLARFFELDDAAVLRYFKGSGNDGSKPLQGQIDLSAVSQIRPSTAKLATDGEMELQTSARTWRLRAGTAAERDEWIRAFRLVTAPLPSAAGTEWKLRCSFCPFEHASGYAELVLSAGGSVDASDSGAAGSRVGAGKKSSGCTAAKQELQAYLRERERGSCAAVLRSNPKAAAHIQRLIQSATRVTFTDLGDVQWSLLRLSYNVM
jgi:hypothetical protein